MIYLALFGRRLLPERTSLAALLTDRSRKKFFTEAVIPPESNLIGREVLGVQLFKREGVRLIDVIRGDTLAAARPRRGAARSSATGWCCAPR